MESTSDYKLMPTFGTSFGTGWKVMSDNFLRLFLVVIILSIIVAPLKVLNLDFNLSDLHKLPWNFGHNTEQYVDSMVTIGSWGIFAAFFGLLGMLYGLLVTPVFQFGGNIIFVKTVRKIKPDFELLLNGFKENYLHIILANLLVIALVVMGFFALIIPGIIIGCRLVFVSYIIMDKKVDPIEAVEMSWKLTRGHGWTIFFMGFVSIFIIILGLCMLIVGIFPAIMWVGSSFASLYESVLKSKEMPSEVQFETPVI